jgi:CheY-like chemotaxis protein
MSHSFSVFVVDDDPLVLEIISAILAPNCRILTFASAEACLEQLGSQQPDFFLLDIKLPGIDGYTLCRKIKDDPALRRIPVTFISSHDTIEDRISGYDAGGEDFIVKPFAPEELLRKLKVAQNMASAQRSLADQLEDAELLSSHAMAGMDEAGILLQFMSQLIAIDDTAEIADGALVLMQRFKLDGVVQTRLPDETRTISAAGKNLPLEVSVIEHVRKLGRIFEFRRRSVHNFERVTLMVNNLPLSDPDYCGRLRDHLSIAAQAIDARLQALQSETARQLAQRRFESALQEVDDAVATLRTAQRSDSTDGARLVRDWQESLLESFCRLGLTDAQEKILQDMVSSFINQMLALLERDNASREALQRISARLAGLRRATEETGAPN